jgi:LPS export ABC transporter protein LptC
MSIKPSNFPFFELKFIPDRLKVFKVSGDEFILPMSVAENINTKYVDSGKLKSVLNSQKMINFSNQEFPFYEFPNGVDLLLLSKNNDTSNVVSNTAVVFTETDIIDLRGDVVLITSTKDTLLTDQLYYDQKKEWLFTDFPVRFRTKNYITITFFDHNTTGLLIMYLLLM